MTCQICHNKIPSHMGGACKSCAYKTAMVWAVVLGVGVFAGLVMGIMLYDIVVRLRMFF